MVATTQRQLPLKIAQAGRIRIGDREPNKSGKGTHPHKLATFRLTSHNRSLLTFAARLYGGTVQPWDSEGAPRDEHKRPTQWELYTERDTLDVLIPTLNCLSVSFEQWKAGGCVRRCTGSRITHAPLDLDLIGQACLCPEDEQERTALAKDGKACQRVLRLNLMLLELPGGGVWRLDSTGWNVTGEARGMFQLLAVAGHQDSLIEAVLRLEQRTTKKLGEGAGSGTLQYAVLVLEPKWSTRRILAGQGERLLLTEEAAPAPPLQDTIALLYGDPRQQPAGEDGAIYLAQIEAALLANHGDIERWYVWAGRRFQKARVTFAREDDATFLDAVRAAASMRQAPPQTAQEAQEGQEAAAGAATTQPDLWQQEEAAERDKPGGESEIYGNGA